MCYDLRIRRRKTGMALATIASGLLGTKQALAQQQFGETCTGTETVQVGSSPAKVLPYHLDFSVDLVTGYYCYAQCRPEQTFAIADPEATPIKLADADLGDQQRLITFNRESETIVDTQTMKILLPITRKANGVCHTTAFHRPIPMSGEHGLPGPSHLSQP